MLHTPARTLALTAAGALLLTVTGCSEGELEIGDARTVAEGGQTAGTQGGDPAATAEPTEPAPLDPRLNPEPTMVGTEGAMALNLLYAWEAYPGTEMAAAGAESMVGGGLRSVSVPAEGLSQPEWEAAFIAGTTEHFVDEQGMEAKEPIVTASGLTVSHLVQVYSDNKAQLFFTVVDDTVHMVRFGLDGSDEASQIAALSAATLSLT